MSQIAASALRRVLRRCENAAATTRANSSRSAIAGARSRSGTSRATAESTLGAGRNAPGGTVKSRSIEKTACSITVSRPYSAVPGAAVMRSTTSFCSITVRSQRFAAYPARWNSSGELML